MNLMLPPITADQIEVSRQSIHRHERRIEELQSEIELHLCVVRQLQAARLQEVAEIRKAESFLTLARRLPEELFAKIFYACVLDNRRSLIALTLSHVCRSWREAALNCPSIWSHISVISRDSYDRIRHWIDHSGHVKLHIDLDITYFIPPDGILPLLRSYIARWCSLEIRSSLVAYANEVLATLDVAAPWMSGLSIVVAENLGENGFDRLQGLSSVFPSSSKFTRLRLETSVLQSGSILPRHIRHLDITLNHDMSQRLTISAIIGMLNGLDDLEELEISLACIEPLIDDIDSHNFTAHHRLRRLTATMTHYCYTAFASHLVLPQLEYLALRNSGRVRLPDNEMIEWQHGQVICGLLERSCAPLLELQLHNFDINTTEYLRCLRAIPTLQTLRLHDGDLEDEVLHALQGQAAQGSPELCPALETIDLRWDSRVSGQALIDLLLSRGTEWKADGSQAGIKSIVLLNCSHIREEDVLTMARTTACRLFPIPEDFCYTEGCCKNTRYRQRLFLRHAAQLSQGNLRRLRL